MMDDRDELNYMSGAAMQGARLLGALASNLSAHAECLRVPPEDAAHAELATLVVKTADKLSEMESARCELLSWAAGLGVTANAGGDSMRDLIKTIRRKLGQE